MAGDLAPFWWTAGLGRMAELVDRWTEIAQGPVPPLPIVEPFDVVVHVGSQFLDGRKATIGQALDFERGKKDFDHRVVPAVDPSAHAADRGMLVEHRLIGRAGVLNA